jgi:hypothetical protein
LLLVLDNVRGEEQLRALLPAAPTCAVLITSRRRIAAEVGAYDVDLGLFEPHEALDLMRVTLGPARVGAEEEVCLEVARRCGYLPPPSRSPPPGSRRVHWTVSRLAGRLAGPRLQMLSSRLWVRAGLALSIGTLEPGARDPSPAWARLSRPSCPAGPRPCSASRRARPRTCWRSLSTRAWWTRSFARAAPPGTDA